MPLSRATRRKARSVHPAMGDWMTPDFSRSDFNLIMTDNKFLGEARPVKILAARHRRLDDTGFESKRFKFDHDYVPWSRLNEPR